MATIKPEHVSYHSNPSYTDNQDQDDLTWRCWLRMTCETYFKLRVANFKVFFCHSQLFWLKKLSYSSLCPKSLFSSQSVSNLLKCLFALSLRWHVYTVQLRGAPGKQEQDKENKLTQATQDRQVKKISRKAVVRQLVLFWPKTHNELWTNVLISFTYFRNIIIGQIIFVQW